MANYRFKTAEIEAMKKNILTHIEREAETKTAWRLRCAIEGLLMCCRPSKREAARLERELALYEKLTKNDLPNWQHEPTQPDTPTETSRISTETSKSANVSVEGEKEAERPQYRVWRFAKPNYAQIIVSDYSQWKVVAVLSFVWGKTQIEVSDDVANIHTIGKKELTIDKPLTELTDAEVLELIYNHTEPPQSPEATQTVERTTDTPKPRETARKPQNRGIGNTRHSRLGAGGYEMLDNASATLTAMSVPRECSTAEERERMNP